MEDTIRLKIIDEIANSPGYDIALITTFNFDISFFERAILNQLSAQNIKKVTLFVDSNEFTKSVSGITSCSVGRRYMVNPIQMQGAFHPKLILLLGEDKAKLIVGSANLTTAGFSLNNEIFNVIRYSSKEPEYNDVINDAIEFFLDIHERSYQLDSTLLEEVKQLTYYHRTNPNGKIRLIHNLNKALLDQIADLIEELVREIRVAVPYFDNSLAALKNIVTVFPDAELSLYLQNGRTSFSEQACDASGIKVQKLVYEGFRDNQSNSRKNFYHGKAFLFKTDSRAYMVYGSANCTQAALTKTYESEGNIECDLIGTGTANEFDYFFQNYEIQKNVELNMQHLVFDTSKAARYNYRFGEITDHGIILHIGSPNANIPDAFLAGEKLVVENHSGEIIITVPIELAEALPEIFEITVKDSDVSENLQCWTYSIEALNAHRQKLSDRYSLEAFEYESEGDKYIQDRINLMNAETMCLPEIREHNKKIAYMNQMKCEQEDNDTGDDDFIVDVEILEEYNRTYRRLNTINRIRGVFFKQLVNNSLSLFSNRGSEVKTTDEEKESHRYNRKPTTEEKRFERFVKNRVKGLTNKDYIDIITTEHYLGIVAVIVDIFEKYCNVDIFDADYVVETKTDLFTAILSKEASDEGNQEAENILLRDCFYILMDNYISTYRTDSMEQKEHLNSINKRLLMAMEKRFSIRSNYRKILVSISDAIPGDLRTYSQNSLFNYLEDLFGYKNYDLLVEYIGTMYDDAEVKKNDDTIKILGKADDMKKELKPNASLLKEIGNYSRVVSPIKTAIIRIKSKPTDSVDNKIKEIEHVVNYNRHNWKLTVLYTNGNRWEEKPEFIGI